MPNKKTNALDPALLPLQPTDLFIVGNPISGKAYKMEFKDLKASILPVASNLLVYYVDGNNPNAGDGSINNPFKTMEAAYNKVKGTGTANNPQFQNISISVAAFTYNTALNIWLNNVTWIFADGCVVNYTDTAYFIDTTIVPIAIGHFKVKGGLTFYTATGGFVKNTGSTPATPDQKVVEIEVHSILGNTPLGATSNPTLSCPLIWIGRDITGGYAPPSLNIQFTYRIESAYQTVIYQENGAWFTLSGGELMGYGRNVNTYAQTGHVDGGVFYYVSGDTSAQAYVSQFLIKDINSVFGINCTSILKMSGAIYAGLFKNLYFISPGSYSNPTVLLELMEVSRAPYSGLFGSLRMDNVQSSPFLSYDHAFDYAIAYSGASANIDVLDMTNCIIPAPYFVDPKVILNSNLGSVAFNIIMSHGHLGNAPVFASDAAAVAGGLKQGMIYKSSTGVLSIVL